MDRKNVERKKIERETDGKGRSTKHTKVERTLLEAQKKGIKVNVDAPGKGPSSDNDMSKKRAGEVVKVMEDDEGDGDDDGERAGDVANDDDGDGDDLFRFTSLQSPACSLPSMQYITAGLILGNWTPRNTNI